MREDGEAGGTMGAGRRSYAGAILPLIERFVGGRPEIGEAEARAWAAEQRELAERGEFFFSCTQFCFSAARGRP
jgi:hypothetical protein